MKRLFYTNEKTDNRIFQYFLGFQPSDGWMLLDDESKEIQVFLDGRYMEKEIQSSPWKITKVHCAHGFLKLLGDYLLADELVMIEKTMPYSVYEKLISPDRDRNILFTFELTSWQSSVRIVKTPIQINAIEQAIDITQQVREHVEALVKNGSLFGKTELRLRGEMIRLALSLGAEGEAFDAIVASGSHTAIPHRSSSDSLITEGALLIDMGWRVNGWCSDFTRTIRLGESPHPEFDTILKVVKQVHSECVHMATAGTSCAALAKHARTGIKDAGYGEYYPHSLGHGVGLDVHEGPRVSGRSEDILKPGMVITIEPGIYLPGKFGVRREDIVIIDG